MNGVLSMESPAIDNRQDKNMRDSLTGAFTREMLFSSLEEALIHGRSHGKPFSLCIIDLDFFKSINDAYGHFRGDQALRELSQQVQMLIRETDSLFRFGGDEFALLLTNSTKEQAMITADRILEHFMMEPIPGDPPIRLSLSIGIATYPDDGSEAETLYQVADRHTYHAKHCGRGVAVGECNALGRWKREGNQRLIEREMPLSKLKGFLQRLTVIRRGVLSIIGPLGTGRTSFLNEAQQLAEMLNFQVLTFPLEKDEKYFKYESEQLEGHDDVLRKDNILSYVRYCIDEEGREGVLLFIDNLSELKRSKYDEILELTTVEEVNGLSLIYTALPESERRIAFPEPSLHENIYLTPLSPPGMHVMLRNILHWEPPTIFLDWLYRETLGNPKLIKEGLRALVKRDILKQTIEHEWELRSDFMDFPLRNLLTRPVDNAHGDLPASLTEFFGRERELGEIYRLLEKSRLVTLRGAGGIGKTRLALQAARAYLRDFQDGVVFIPLATVAKSEWVIPTIAKAMNIQENSGLPVKEALEESLKTKERLLIIDNVEQVTESAVMFADLLKAAPRLKLLITSREALHLSGEHILDVPPLDLSGLENQATVEESLRQPAIALFVNRAQASNINFTLNEENVCAVAEICRRLEGIPLAIELAAANIGHMNPMELLSQRGTHLDWLKNGPRDLPERHQTIRATLEWSYNLLTPDEQYIFSILGVFTGGFTTEALAYVSDRSDRLNPEKQADLNALTNKSLLQKLPDSTVCFGHRFQMLETIREYALELLEKRGESTEYRQRHAEYYRDLAEKSVQHLVGPRQKEWMHTLELEHANLRAALDWAEAWNSPEFMARLAGTMGMFWETGGHWTEGYHGLKRALERMPKDSVNADMAQLYHWVGWFASLQGDFDEAMILLSESMKLFKALEMSGGIAAVHHRMGWTMYLKGQFRSAKEEWEKSLTLYRETKEASGIATVLRDLGRAEYYFGDYERSETLCWESLELSRKMQYPKGIARALHWLGEIARSKGDYDQSVELFQESLNHFQALGDRFEVANTTFSLGELYRSRGDMEQATQLFQYHLKLSHELGYRPGYAYALLELGEIARYQGDAAQALAYYRQCLELLDSIGEYGRMSWVYRDMAEVSQTQADYAMAKTLYQKSLGLLREDGHVMLIALSLGGLAGAERGLGDPVRAARLFGAAEARFECTRPQIAIDDIKDYEDRMNAVRNELGEATFAAALDEGRNVPLRDALAYALEEASFGMNKLAL